MPMRFLVLGVCLGCFVSTGFAQDRLGYYAWDTGTGQVIQQHATQRFPLCSTSKLMIVGAILKASMSQPKLLDKRDHFSRHFLQQAGYAPITKQHVKTGMTLAALCAAAIEYSDSAAANLLMKQLGGPKAVTAFAHSIGNASFRLDRWEPQLNTSIPGDPRDTATPKSMAKSLYALTEGRVLGKQQQQLLIRWLVNSKTGAHRIRAAVPKGWRVGDKTGSGQYGTTNDVAILWPPHHAPIVMAIYYTQAKQDAAPNDQMIARVARYLVNKSFNTA